MTDADEVITVGNVDRVETNEPNPRSCAPHESARSQGMRRQLAIARHGIWAPAPPSKIVPLTRASEDVGGFPFTSAKATLVLTTGRDHRSRMEDRA
jgi:hypothetical protein